MIFHIIIWSIKLVVINSAVLHKADLIHEINELRETKAYFGKDSSMSIFENKTSFRYSHDAKRRFIYRALHGSEKEYEMHVSHSPGAQALNIATRDMSNYDYEYLLDEYYEETLNETKLNSTYRVYNKNVTEPNIGVIRKLVDLHSKKCSQGDGIKAIVCLFIEYYNRKLPFCMFVSRLWKILRIWFLIYMVLAIPLWCTRGLCCCCLFCKFFKPHQTIEDAKKYLMNPPGLLRTTKGHELLYEPKKSERDMYEEFEHLIRTI